MPFAHKLANALTMPMRMLKRSTWHTGCKDNVIFCTFLFSFSDSSLVGTILQPDTVTVQMMPQGSEINYNSFVFI